jgi:integrative and conjugative element protein (TIGR02256 family)
LLIETKEKLSTETGGIFLGVMSDDVWYITESIDPGPRSIFRAAYFEYDGDYVRHLANKVNRLYNCQLDVLGLWHRHPGSMDTFSSTDDGTIKKFAEQNNGITISALVNVDPRFRLTMYVATLNPLAYEKISYEIDDSRFPQDIINVLNHIDVEKQINSMKKEKPFSRETNIDYNMIGFRNILSEYLEKKTERYAVTNDVILENNENEYNFIIDNYLVDECLFCDELGVSYSCDCVKGTQIELIIGDDKLGIKLSFYMLDLLHLNIYPRKRCLFRHKIPFLSPVRGIEAAGRKHLCFIHKNSIYLYPGNLLKTVWEASGK